MTTHRAPLARRRAPLAAALLGAAALLAGACSTAEPGRTGSIVVFSDDGQFLPAASGPGAVPDTENSYIPDCPPPIGFVPIAEECAASVTPSGARSVYHLYQGRAAPVDVQAMYHRTLPLHDWKYTGTRADPDTGHDALIFEKGPETLYVRVRQDRSKTTLIIEISPR